jgi:hypothetical protein
MLRREYGAKEQVNCTKPRSPSRHNMSIHWPPEQLLYLMADVQLWELLL